MSEPARPTVNLVSLGIGLAAAGVGAALGVAAERVAMGRPLLRAAQDSGEGGEDAEEYGQLHVPGLTVLADDGTELHVEVDEVDPARAEPAGAEEVPVTVVLCHGYALTMDSWHFQRKALRGRYRLVCWDQRGHGRSGFPGVESATIDQLGRDLGAVIDAVASTGPLILIGHSMGGMTVMALAEQRPELFAERVRGVGLVSTSPSGLKDLDFGLSGVGRLLQRVGPTTVRALSRTPRLVAQGRRLGSDLEAVLVRRFSYSSPVSGDLVEFTAGMIASVPLEVIGAFLPTLADHDRTTVLARMHGLEVLVIVGDDDLLTPADHSLSIAAELPEAEHVVVRQGGHLLMLEHPEVVTGHLTDLVERSVRAKERAGGRARRHPRVSRTITSLRRHRHRGGAA